MENSIEKWRTKFALLVFAVVYFVLLSKVDGCLNSNIEIRNGTWCVNKRDGVKVVYTTPGDPIIHEPGEFKTSNCFCGIVEKASRFQPRVIPINKDEVHRPWLVHVVLRSDTSGAKRECTGTILNKRWLITAAGCFCGSIIQCDSNQKVFTLDQDPSIREIEIFVDHGSKEMASKRKDPVSKIIIHDQYKQNNHQVNVALLKTSKDLFDENDPNENGDKAHPICLPDTTTAHAVDFCDVDDDLRVKCPYDEKNPLTMDRKNRVSGWGSATRHGENRQCLTNSFGPRPSIYQPCKTNEGMLNPCLNNTQYEGDLAYDNPSQLNEICRQFIQTSLKDALEKHKELEKTVFQTSERNTLGFVTITDNAETINCFPQSSTNDMLHEYSMENQPFRHGWCRVEGQETNAESGWGWCTPQCAEDPSQPDFHARLNEAAVDSFYRQDCTDTQVVQEYEFCTGFPTLQTYSQKWNRLSNGTFQFVDHVARQIRTDLAEPGYEKIPDITPVLGDVCTGDVGGSVWRKLKYKGDTYAILTGVVGRDESNCGVYYAGQTPRFAVHTSVPKIKNWILEIIDETDTDGICKN